MFQVNNNKALDSVNHDILVLKLETYGITGKDKKLYQSYLKGRYQRPLIYNKTHQYSTLSNQTLIKNGVTQGYILGPLFFLSYINDLPHFVNNKYTSMLFAGDTSILYSLKHNRTEIKYQ